MIFESVVFVVVRIGFFRQFLPIILTHSFVFLFMLSYYRRSIPARPTRLCVT